MLIASSIILLTLIVLWVRRPDPDDDAAGIIRDPYSGR